MDGGLQVVAGFGRSTTTINRLKQLVGWLTPLSPALIGAGLVGWLVMLTLLWHGNQQLAATLLAIVIAVSFGGIMLSQWVGELSAEITRHTQLRTAQEQLASILDRYLDGNWTLYHSISSEAASLLVGRGGVYRLDLLFIGRVAQVQANKWLFRDEDGNWELSKDSPTRKATQKALQLQGQLSAENISVHVQPRVVWAGEQPILLDEPATPVWWLAQAEGMLADLRQNSEGITDETIDRIQIKLEKIIEQARSDTLFRH